MAGALACATMQFAPAFAGETLPDPIHIGLDADFSGASPDSGLAIERGMRIAMGEINAAGGVLGRPLDIVARDNRGVIRRGLDNLEELLAVEEMVAVLGGTYSPVMLAQVPVAQKNELILVSPWAAATPITENGLENSYTFRLSVRDDYAAEFLVLEALRRGHAKIGLLLWQSAWGASNDAAMTAAALVHGARIVGRQWFNVGDRNLKPQVDALIEGGSEVIMLVSGGAEGMAAVAAMAARDEAARVPFIAHWGITAGDFHAKNPEALDSVDLTVLQTVSFFDPPNPEIGARILKAYCTTFGPCASPADVAAPVGVAHAYDIVHLLARAIEKAGSTDRSAVRSAMEQLEPYEGLVRLYDPAFTPHDHDALGIEDYSLARYLPSGVLVPANAAGH